VGGSIYRVRYIGVVPPRQLYQCTTYIGRERFKRSGVGFRPDAKHHVYSKISWQQL
jgi:hypothetical protein